MTSKPVTTTIEVLGKLYPIRCQESEVASLQQAAEYLDTKMLEVQNSGKILGLDRIAIITALNIAHQLLHTEQQKTGYMNKLNQRLADLQKKMDQAMQTTMPLEPAYSE